MDNELTNKSLLFAAINGIDSFVFLCGLNFPDSATEFQKALLTMAHLSAICRENVLHGVDVPQRVLDVIDQLNWICQIEQDKQR